MTNKQQVTITISGATGTGKTSMATALADILSGGFNLPVDLEKPDHEPYTSDRACNNMLSLKNVKVKIVTKQPAPKHPPLVPHRPVISLRQIVWRIGEVKDRSGCWATWRRELSKALGIAPALPEPTEEPK